MEYIADARAAEENAVQVLRDIGYGDAALTGGSDDGGIDVVSRRAVAQVKWQGGVAERSDLQRLFGARGNEFLKDIFFFSAAGYSASAVEYADVHNIGLFTYDPIGRVSSNSRFAESFLKDSFGEDMRVQQDSIDDTTALTLFARKFPDSRSGTMNIREGRRYVVDDVTGQVFGFHEEYREWFTSAEAEDLIRRREDITQGDMEIVRRHSKQLTLDGKISLEKDSLNRLFVSSDRGKFRYSSQNDQWTKIGT